MKKIFISVGLLVILAAVALYIVTIKNDKAQIAMKRALVVKYVNLSASDLATNNIQGAIQSAKLAIQANPMNNAGFISYQNALKIKYQPKNSYSQPAASATPAQSSSSNDSMGC